MSWFVHLLHQTNVVSSVVRLEEIIDDFERPIFIALGNKHLHSSSTTSGCGVGCDGANELILKESIDAFAFQYAFEKVRVHDIAGINDVKFLVHHSVPLFQG